MPTITISSVCYNADGTLDCTVSASSGTPVAIFGKVVNNPLANQSSPWHEQSSNPPTQGSIAGSGLMSVRGIPAGGTSGTLIVWCMFQEGSSFVREPFEFTTDGSGSGNSIGPCPEMDLPPKLRQAWAEGVPEAMPRVYELTIDVDSLHLQGYGAGYLAAGLLASAKLHLTYDERASTLTRFVWSGRNLADATGKWTLRVECKGACSRAELTYQQVGQRKVSKPQVWLSGQWEFFARNTLSSQGGHCGQLPMPTIRVEPA